MGSLHLTLQNHQRAILSRDGKAWRWLEPGRHSFWAFSADFSTTIFDLSAGYTAYTPELAAMLPQGEGQEVVVKVNQRAILTVDDRPAHFLEPGRYILWTQRASVKAWLFDVDTLVAEISDHFAAIVPSHDLREFTVRDDQRAFLRCDGRVVKFLKPGRHMVWRLDRNIDMLTFDLSAGYTPYTPELAAMLPQGEGQEVLVGPQQRAILTIDGRPTHFLEPGRYIQWTQRAQVKAWLFDVDTLVAEISDHFAAIVPSHYLREVTVRDDQRAFLRCNGRVVAYLEPGRHAVWQIEREIEVVFINVDVVAMKAAPELVALLPKDAYSLLEVPEGNVAIVSVDGQSTQCLSPGQYVLWQLRSKVSAKLYSTEPLMSLVPEVAWPLVPTMLMITRVVRPFERGLLYVNGKLEQVLDAGRYAINCDRRHVELSIVDMREQELQISGQEVMTADKVTLRLNLIVRYRIKDAMLSVEAQSNLANAIYGEAQMAARRYIAGVPVDALLESRNDASDVMTSQLTARATTWGVEILQIDLKDLILPGEMKSLLNQVIEAEKKAQAQVIMRREETAATRSQANTAKMLESNPTLMRLKELEAIKEIAANIPNLTVVVSADEMLDKLKLLK